MFNEGYWSTRVRQDFVGKYENSIVFHSFVSFAKLTKISAVGKVRLGIEKHLHVLKEN